MLCVLLRQRQVQRLNVFLLAEASYRVAVFLAFNHTCINGLHTK